jgi:hypothetical protein
MHKKIMKKMKKTTFILLVTAFVTALAACKQGETYGEKKEQERAAIDQFILDSAIVVIDEAQFALQGNMTDAKRNQYVYMTKSGVYMQIVNKGDSVPLKDGETANILVRYLEYNIQAKIVLSTNMYDSRYYDKMTVSRNQSSYNASFVEGDVSIPQGNSMYSTYNTTSVPPGWLVPLPYINLGRHTSPEGVARVKLIVPHTQGQTSASASVYPCFYIISYERGA